MLDKKLNCESRVVFVALALLFLLVILFGKFFAIIGLLATAYVAFTGVCMGAKILGPAFCKKSVLDALGKVTIELKSAASEAIENVKGKIKR